ncbi:MAG: hypothetical protein LIO46_07555, partial [Clostridiales bacterium]|nr:hypothetical protein [Clostridiales bacterium]
MRNLWKKSFALIGVLALLLALAACSGAEEADATSAPETQSTTEAEPETTTQPETEEEPEEKAQDDDDPSQTPSVEAAIQMYREAGKKTKTADSFTARKEQSSA